MPSSKKKTIYNLLSKVERVTYSSSGFIITNYYYTTV